MSILNVDLRSAPPTTDEMVREIEHIQRQIRFRAVAVAAITLATVIWMDFLRPATQVPASQAWLVSGVFILMMALCFWVSWRQLRQFKKADPLARMQLESLSDRADIARYVHLVQKEGRELTAGEAQALLSIAGYSRSKEEEAVRQAAYRRIHSLTN